MPTLKVGNTEVSDVRVGNTQVEQVYAGSSKIWENALANFTMVAGTYTSQQSYSDQGGSTTYTDYTYKGYATIINGSSFSGKYTLHGGSDVTVATFWSTKAVTYNSQTPSYTTTTGYSRFGLWGQVANSGWNSITVNGNTKNRADANFTLGLSYLNNCWWEWPDYTWIPGSGTHEVVLK